MQTTFPQHVAALDELVREYQSVGSNSEAQKTLGARLFEQTKMALPILQQLARPVQVPGDQIILSKARYNDVCPKCTCSIWIGDSIAFVGDRNRGKKEHGPFHAHCVQARQE